MVVARHRDQTAVVIVVMHTLGNYFAIQIITNLVR